MTANNHKMLKTCDVKMDGKTWQEREQRRIQAMKDRAQPPVSCGPSIIAAPARGACVVVPNVSLLPQGRDRWGAVHTGYGGHDAVRQMDVFDRMVVASSRRKRMPLVTPGQISIGRRYRDLVELLTADGCRLSTLEQSFGSGDSGGWMDRRLQLADEVDALRRRIGQGVALQVRRVRPSDRGDGHRGTILDRVLVDSVCIAGSTLDQVLKKHGWAKSARTYEAVAQALCGALDRMIGYRS